MTADSIRSAAARRHLPPRFSHSVPEPFSVIARTADFPNPFVYNDCSAIHLVLV
jgi:hypothetical protein